MTEDKKTPETIEDKDLDQAQGGYSVWIGGSVKKPADESVVTSRGTTMAIGSSAEEENREFEDKWSTPV